MIDDESQHSLNAHSNAEAAAATVKKATTTKRINCWNDRMRERANASDRPKEWQRSCAWHRVWGQAKWAMNYLSAHWLDRAKAIHIAFINIIKSLSARSAAILNSTVFFISCFAFFFSFSLPLPIHAHTHTSYTFGSVLLSHCCRCGRRRRCRRCCCFLCFFPYHCITKATLPLLMLRIPMFFSLLFQSVSCFFLFVLFYYFANYTRRMCTNVTCL